ncbi:RNA-guided endonuclease InsQ/TnpB family protein [Clostridium sp. M14]|uniref:RNA-guided endonuclease InsQ/TnpB family protein n=1 Tax=Clostridium sp. M14 TaxID=2716311 RepID=UPI0013EE6249|nr:RNA-guided endonuclease TnpB family protein [Clostridium sp. M14]MBZ9693302.1 transposase [Clostridium sp. M14]
MIKTLKIQLKPNNKQKTKMFQFAGAKRFAYNWALAKEQENYKNCGKFISDNDLRKDFTQLKKQEEYKWLYSISNNVTKQAVKDACISYKRFFKGQAKFPKFKSKKFDRPSFYVDNVKIKFSETHVKLENIAISKKKNKAKLNWIRLCEKNKIPMSCKYINPHVVYDGENWFICVGIEFEGCIDKPNNDGIGIDLGIKDLAICSDKHTYKNINKSSKIKKLEKKRRRLQRQISRKYLINKEGSSYVKTSNIIKSEKKFLKLNHRLTNIRDNYLHQVTSEMIKRKPNFITIEDLNVRGMMKNKHLSKAIQQQKFYEFRRQLEYKCKWNNIELRIVDRFYPSSKLCHECGCIKKDLKLSDRVYICEECGNVIDRDYQASLNLRDCITYNIA